MNYMNFSEAYDCLLDGKWIARHNWHPSCYLKTEEDKSGQIKIVDENGIDYTYDFLSYINEGSVWSEFSMTSRERLKGHRVYLAGSIDESAHTAHVWREDISEFLQNLSIGVYNPCDKPCGKKEDPGFVEHCNNLKQSENWEQLVSEMTDVVRADLHMVDLSNFMIAAIDKDLHLCGSYSEITYAALEKKPVIIWCPQGKSAVPNWLWGMGLKHEMFFDTLEEVKKYIQHIHDDAKVDDLGRWRFVDYGKVFGV